VHLLVLLRELKYSLNTGLLNILC